MQIKRTLIRTLYSLNLPSDVKKGEAVMVKTGFSGKVGGGGGISKLSVVNWHLNV